MKYLESGNDFDLPFCESDLELPLFSDFIKKLQEGFDDVLREFFKIDWNFYIDSSKSDCDCILNLNIGFRYNRCYIPEELLRRANVLDVEKISHG